MPIITFQRPFADGGAFTLNNGFRNGAAPSGHKIRRVLADRVNTIGTQRQKIPFCKSIRAAQSYNGVAAATTWRFQWHTSPNCTRMGMKAVIAPIFDAAAVTPDPIITWKTTIVGGASANQESIYHLGPENGTAAVVPDDQNEITQYWDVTADTTYRAELTQEDEFRILTCTVWEIPAVQANTADTNIVDPAPYHELGAIYDSDAAELQTVVTKLWKTMGAHYFSWCVDADGGKTVASATWTNVVDASTAGISATSQGFHAWPNYHGSLDGFDSGASTEDIPVSIYAYLKTSNAASAAQCRFVDAAGTIGTLSSTSTTGEWVTSDVVWTASTAATAVKIDVEFNNVSGVDTSTCLAAGMYEYEAP